MALEAPSQSAIVFNISEHCSLTGFVKDKYGDNRIQLASTTFFDGPFHPILVDISKSWTRRLVELSSIYSTYRAYCLFIAFSRFRLEA